MMFKTVKLFDLALAPPDIRESWDFLPLRPKTAGLAEQPLFWCNVGDHEFWSPNVPASDDGTGTVSLSEYMLHKWLSGSGADLGETVILTWSSTLSVPCSLETTMSSIQESSAQA